MSVATRSTAAPSALRETPPAPRRMMLGVGVWGLMDQTLVSATNFVTMVLVARALGPASFGSFALVYTVLLFSTELQGALVTQPHNVLGAGLTGSSYSRYTRSTAFSQILLAGSLGSSTAAAGLIAHGLGWHSADLLLALAPAIVGWLSQEFVRRVLYTEGRMRAVLLNDLVSYGGQAGLIVVLSSSERLDGPSALLALAVTSGLAVPVGLWQLRGSFHGVAQRADVGGNWQFGKWLAGGLLAYWCASQLYLYMTAALVSTTAAGLLKAALVLMGPLNVLLVFMDTAVPIMLVRSFAASGERGFRAQLREALILTAPIVGTYCAVVAVFAVPLVRRVYGERYATEHSALLPLLALNYVVIYASRLLASALRAQRQTKPIFRGHLYAGIVGVAAGWLLVRLGGVEGAALGMVAGAAVGLTVVLRAFVAGSATSRGRPAGLESISGGGAV
jgi:O-antigen/teichoic acid export membrane protein